MAVVALTVLDVPWPCYLVPCDRSVEIAADVAGVPEGTPCDLELRPAEHAGSRVRRVPLQDGEASVTIGPGSHAYLARVRCGERRSAEVAVDFAGVDRVDLGVVLLTDG